MKWGRDHNVHSSNSGLVRDDIVPTKWLHLQKNNYNKPKVYALCITAHSLAAHLYNYTKPNDVYKCHPPATLILLINVGLL